MTKARLTSHGLQGGRARLTYPRDSTPLAVERAESPDAAGTVEAEGVCKACAKAAEASEHEGFSVIVAPTGKPHYTVIDNHGAVTLCGRDASDW